MIHKHTKIIAKHTIKPHMIHFVVFLFLVQLTQYDCVRKYFPGITKTTNVQANIPAPARYSTPSSLVSSTRAATSGEIILNTLPQKLAIPLAVPLIGAGKLSGVHPYSTALKALWKKYTALLTAV